MNLYRIFLNLYKFVHEENVYLRIYIRIEYFYEYLHWYLLNLEEKKKLVINHYLALKLCNYCVVIIILIKKWYNIIKRIDFNTVMCVCKISDCMAGNLYLVFKYLLKNLN